MSAPVAAQPELYRAEGPEPPSLSGKRCTVCGHVFFPPHPYGCDACGASAEKIETVELAGTGTLRAFATVHPQRVAHAPFTVASIELDRGPTIRALLTCATDEELSIGDRVHAVRVSRGTGAEGRQVLELRFTPEGDE